MAILDETIVGNIVSSMRVLDIFGENLGCPLQNMLKPWCLLGSSHNLLFSNISFWGGLEKRSNL